MEFSLKAEYCCVTLSGECVTCPLRRNLTPALVLVHYDKEAIDFYFQ